MAIKLNGYSVYEDLYNGKNTAIYRALSHKDNISVVMKHLNKEFPSPDDLARFTREYQITSKLKGDGIMKTLGLEKYNNSLVMINEDFGGKSMAAVMAEHKPGLIEKITFAAALTDTLGQIHRQSIIHKDINPSNIIWNNRTETVKIIDFGISTELSVENPEICNPNVLEGTIAYISPEQTGRMNRTVGYRTDLYSLGITFYELFTGERPFNAADAMGYIHCHIAVMPKAPSEINPEIPDSISAIIMKLLAKAPEDRYQSSLGLKKDLEFCLNRITTGKPHSDFIPGRHDNTGRFQIPQKLYGREEELDTLMNAFDRISQGTKEIMLVAGYSGIGKSALVHEINKPIVAMRGNFISGKFDQFKRNIPYSALIQAFQSLIRNLLAEHDDQLRIWRGKMLEALGPSGQVIIDVIPETELIIGSQPKVQDLPPDQARNRFHIVFQNFIRVFADKTHPLCMFIDDLQWADLPSIHLIEQFMLDTATRYLLIIGSYRDNEVNPSHPLLMTMDSLKKNGAAINTIILKPLNPNQVNRLISDTISCDPEHAYPLSRLCYEKTMGNPFFLYQLLYTLHENKALIYNEENGIWDFNADQIGRAEITENVIDLMVKKIKRLKPETQEALKIASCIGNSFDLTTLSMITEKPAYETAGFLFEALEERLIFPLDDSYKFITETRTGLNVEYRFVHDRIIQAAYSLLPEHVLKSIHLQLGRILLKYTPDDQWNEKFFDIINHLNLGSDLITESDEKNLLAELNLNAGQRAKQSAAYKPSYEYLKTGIALCGENGWETSYLRMLALHTEAMESAYLNMNYRESDLIYKSIIQHAHTIMDKAKATDIKIVSLIAESRFNEAMDTGLDVLAQLGVRMPKKPNKKHVIAGLLKIKFLLMRYKDKDILSAPPMKDPLAIAQASILHMLASTSLFSRPEFYPLIIFKRVELTLKYGDDPVYSYSAINSLGLIFCSIGKIEEGYHFGKLAEKLLEKSAIKKEKTRLLLLMNMFIRHWKEPLRVSLKHVLAGYESRVETGDIEYASHCVSDYCNHIFLCGIDLKTVDKEQAGFLQSIGLLKQKSDIDNIAVFHQLTLNLMDTTKPLTEFSGASFNESVMVPTLKEEGNKIALFIYHLYKMYQYYTAGEYNLAFDQASHADLYKMSVRAFYLMTIYNLYDSLTRLALCTTLNKNTRESHLQQVMKNQKQMKTWAHHAPHNHLHKWHLVEAETARIMGNSEQAKTHYKLAVKSAKENDFIQEEALANECYALFFLSEGEEDFAGLTMKKARYGYHLWGAAAKVAQLEKAYPHLLQQDDRQYVQMSPKSTYSDLIISETKTASSEILDMATLLKASRMITREIVLSGLIEKLLDIAMENAGAQKGFVLMEQDGKFFIEGEAVHGKKGVDVLKSIPVEQHGGISSSIVNYVSRTQKTLILDDASNEGAFTDDPYVIRKKPKSIMCTAIMNQGNITAILYMENNLTRAAFRPERMELLTALAAQAAISITNARLYENLEEKVRERTKELNLSLQEVKERTEELDRTLKVVEESKEKIMSSIRYSGIIQNSLLPDPASIASFLPDSFFIWKPRDIVGGDIYVCEKLDNGILVAIIDCTGHGVPGAFMTMLASSGLRRIIHEDRIYKPADVLKALNHIIKTSLQQDKDHTRSDDGLDAGVCYFDESSRVLIYSGARIPLYYIEKGNLITVKGDKQSLGYVSSDLSYEFSTHTIENKDLSRSFYLATDGFADQLGGDVNSRFGNKKLKELLVRNHRLSFANQSRILLEVFEDHRGRTDRTDDVTIAGFRFV